ncbi:MAG: DNA-processing protein DprA [Gammaproteobacteria bacterium]|jgi:DNA processing protein|nr:DNA-binding protein [Nitrospinota bacterium]MDP6097641.1 DNA-processing protein DprA [Gammaproteobacteria bacterium]MDP6288977.1 DNA-processing protein DprA [Arenicellales bacterium]MDP7445262.1 DNA-processing protein DprA [Candidatus Poseidoniia archaeon]|tara:strand:- start:571 stop:1545 length:975 start_codon:yes stop_codon:yes gene_type:complete
MKFTDNAINVMTARTYKGIGKAWITKNLFTPKTEAEIVQLLSNSPKVDGQITIDEFNREKSHLKDVLAESKGSIDGVVALGDADFPPIRGVVKNSEKPIFLFYCGDLSLLTSESKNVAVIGLLNPDQEIKNVERELVAGLVENGAVIVSGLALGCDTIAHRQALDSKGRTVAILPGPLNDVIPAKNRALAEEIVKSNGLLISEYLTSANSKMEMSGRYQERDRLQALYSNSIVLSASYAKNDIGNDSGSRLAMGYAKDYSIPRVVIYDKQYDANNPMYDLNRQILGEDSNILLANRHNSSSVARDILLLKPKIAKKQPVQQSMF